MHPDHAILDEYGKILEYTASFSEEQSWNRFLGFHAVDDQWAYQVQLKKEQGYTCQKVKLVCETYYILEKDWV